LAGWSEEIGTADDILPALKLPIFPKIGGMTGIRPSFHQFLYIY
jgi:hypothetical protein